MKEFTVLKFKTVAGGTPEEFDRNLNEALAEFKTRTKPEIDIEHNREDFRAYIRYEDEVYEPENVRDEMNLAGITLFCGDCPDCKRYASADGTVDKRIKRGMCAFKGFDVSLDAEACVRRYALYKESID